MSGPDTRRGFLRGLASLPLIGGGVALVGSPTAVDVEVSTALLANYATFLEGELRMLRYEIEKRLEWPAGALDQFAMTPGDFHFPRKGSWLDVPQPSTRAALVLATVGAPMERPKMAGRYVFRSALAPRKA